MKSACFDGSLIRRVFDKLCCFVEVVNMYVPLCHGFLGNVFVSVDWSTVVRRSLTAFGSELNARLHACLLHLLVKFPYEPSLKMVSFTYLELNQMSVFGLTL